MVKTPKLYFTDTGLACSLLGIRQARELANSYFRGALFENYVIAELYKLKYNTGSQTNFYYWRNNKGVEVDLLMDDGKNLFPMEIKTTQTFKEEYLKPMQQWNSYIRNIGGMFIYDGKQEFTRKDKIAVQNWRTIAQMNI